MIHKNLIIESVIPNQIVIEKLKTSRDTINTMNASVFKLKKKFQRSTPSDRKLYIN